MTEREVLSREDTSSRSATFEPDLDSEVSKLSKSVKKKFLKAILAKANERGLTATQVVNQSLKIDQLEKKYGKTFDELREEFESFESELEDRSNLMKELDQQISTAEKKKSDLLYEYMVDEKSLREYVDARERLSPIGFAVDDLPKVKAFLFAIKNLGFSAEQVVQKLNSIGDLEARRSAAEAELGSVNGDLREKKAILIELLKIQQSGLSMDQIDRLREVVTKISARRGINSDQAVTYFESDILKNYDMALGLEGEVLRLQDTKSSLHSEFEGIRRELEEEQRTLASRNSELESRYEKMGAELQALAALKGLGIEGSKLLYWQAIVSTLGLDYGVLEAELKKQGDLKRLQEEEKKKIEDLEMRERTLSLSISALKEQKISLDSSVSSVKDLTLRELEANRLLLSSSISQVTMDAKQILDRSKNDLNTTLADAGHAVNHFSSTLSGVLDRAESELKNFDQLLEAAETLGKYRAILPLLQLGDADKVTETEGLVAMWNTSSLFLKWLERQSLDRGSRSETLEQVKRTLAALSRDIQTVGNGSA